MKNLVVALAMSLVSLNAQAKTDNFTGFYMGGHVGYGSTTGKLTSQGTHGLGHAHPGTPRDIKGVGSVGSQNHNVGLMGGYGIVLEDKYVGVEMSYTHSNDTIKSTLGNDVLQNKYQLELKRKGYISAALRTGCVLTDDSIFYIRFGFNHGIWTFNDNLTSNFDRDNPANKSSSHFTFAPGLGFESSFEGLLVRFEYIYEIGKRMKAISNTQDIQYKSSYSNIGKIRTQSGKVGLVYKF